MTQMATSAKDNSDKKINEEKEVYEEVNGMMATIPGDAENF